MKCSKVVILLKNYFITPNKMSHSIFNWLNVVLKEVLFQDNPGLYFLFIFSFKVSRTKKFNFLLHMCSYIK